MDAAGNVYVAGTVSGALKGQQGWGSDDAYLRKYDRMGDELWTRQLGSDSMDRSWSVAVDREGNVYVAGDTAGVLKGQATSGTPDGFLAKFAPTGEEHWVRQFGSTEGDLVNSIAVDRESNVYVAGQTSCPERCPSYAPSAAGFLSRFDSEGSLIWTRRFPRAGGAAAHGVDADQDGNVYVTGSVSSDPVLSETRGFRAFLRKFDSDGEEVWLLEWGYSAASDVALGPDGSIYLVGATQPLSGKSSFGNNDSFLRRYDAAGRELWTRQWGTERPEWPKAVAVDKQGAIYVLSGRTGALPGQTTAGGSDVFVSRYDGNGDELWTYQFGSPEHEQTSGLALDGAGNIYVAGDTTGTLPGATRSGETRETFLLQLVQP